MARTLKIYIFSITVSSTSVAPVPNILKFMERIYLPNLLMLDKVKIE